MSLLYIHEIYHLKLNNAVCIHLTIFKCYEIVRIPPPIQTTIGDEGLQAKS